MISLGYNLFLKIQLLDCWGHQLTDCNSAMHIWERRHTTISFQSYENTVSSWTKPLSLFLCIAKTSINLLIRTATCHTNKTLPPSPPVLVKPLSNVQSCLKRKSLDNKLTWLAEHKSRGGGVVSVTGSHHICHHSSITLKMSLSFAFNQILQ